MAESAYAVALPDQILHQAPVTCLIQGVGVQAPLGDLGGFPKAAPARQRQRPAIDQIAPVPAMKLCLISLPIFERERVPQIEAMHERSPVELGGDLQRLNALWANLVGPMTVIDRRQSTRFLDVKPKLGAIESNPIAVCLDHLIVAGHRRDRRPQS